MSVKISTDITSSRAEMLECIEKILGEFIGEAGFSVLRLRCRRTSLSWEDILDNPEKFEEALDAVFGMGSKAIKNAMTRRIRNQFPDQECGVALIFVRIDCSGFENLVNMNIGL